METTLLKQDRDSLAAEPDVKLLRKIESFQRILRPTPIVKLELEGLDLNAKLEFQNPFGSVKDRPAFWVLKNGVKDGDIRQGSTIVESSSGNFALSLAVLCNMFGLKFVPVIDPNITSQYEDFLRRTCERVEMVSVRDKTGGFLHTRLNRVQELLKEIPGSIWTNQYGNRHNMGAHYALTGKEICDAFEKLDYLFIGVSSGGTIAGVSNRVKEKWPNVKVIAVDAEGSVIFGGQPKKRHLPGLGSSIQPPLVEHAIIDEVVIVPEKESITGCSTLLKQHGLFAGGSSGTVFSAITRYAPNIADHQNPPVVMFLCADRGSAYLDNIYNPKWVARHYA